MPAKPFDCSRFIAAKSYLEFAPKSDSFWLAFFSALRSGNTTTRHLGGLLLFLFNAAEGQELVTSYSAIEWLAQAGMIQRVGTRGTSEVPPGTVLATSRKQGYALTPSCAARLSPELPALVAEKPSPVPNKSNTDLRLKATYRAPVAPAVQPPRPPPPPPVRPSPAPSLAQTQYLEAPSIQALAVKIIEMEASGWAKYTPVELPDRMKARVNYGIIMSRNCQ